MPSSVQVYTSESYIHTNANANADLIIISDQKESFTSKFADFASVSGVVDEADIALLTSVAANRLTSCEEIPTSTELYVRGLTSTDPPRRVVLALLPFKYGRHSAPSRSHSVASLVKSHRGSSKELVVILAPSSSDYLFPQALAVGRQFPLYCSKSSSIARKEKDLKVSVVLKAPEFSQEMADSMGNVIDGIRLAQRLVDSPPNDLHTDAYVEECQAVASRTGCKIQVCNASGNIVVAVHPFCRCLHSHQPHQKQIFKFCYHIRSKVPYVPYDNLPSGYWCKRSRKTRFRRSVRCRKIIRTSACSCDSLSSRS